MASIEEVSEWRRGAVQGASQGPEAPWAVVLPGMGYTAAHPLLFWCSTALVESGWHVLTVSWDTAGIDLPADMDDGAALVDRAWHAACAHLPEGRAPALLVGKSLGTLATGAALAVGADVVALTPLLATDSARYPRVPPTRRMLAVGGTSDPLWDVAAARRLGAETVEVPAGDHSLQLAGHWRESLRVVEHIAGAVQDFAAVSTRG